MTKFSVAGQGGKIDSDGSRKDSKRGLADYGLDSNHIPLMEGITFPPERRSSLLKGMGPLAIAITAIHEPTYKEKPLKALYESIQMIPMANAIKTVLSLPGKDGHQSLLKALGDVLILTGARTTHRLSMPLTFAAGLYVHLKDKVELKHWSFSGPRI